MAKVTVYHPALDWSKEVEEKTARVLERSGWVIGGRKAKKGVDATVSPAPATPAITPNEPTEDPDPSVSSEEPSSEE